MKENKNDPTSALQRFGRDRRTRTVTATAERVERRPRVQQSSADAGHPSGETPRRASYNPHFTKDNRPAFGDGQRRSFGEKPRYGSRPAFGDRKPYGDKPYDRKPYGEREERPFGERKSYGEREEHSFGERKPYGGRKSYGERSAFGSPEGPGRKPQGDRERRYGDKPAYGAAKPGTKKFGGKPGGKFAKPGFRKRDDKPASYPKYNPEKQVGEMRLNRFIAQSGICSRREADDFITAGVVTVNGKVVTELGTKVLPTDEVRFNDSRVQGEKKVYLVLNKPKGYVTSLDDPHATKTVMDLVKGACEERIYPVGRLDKNSLGLLLFTNDGDLTKQLTHPAYLKKKIYQVSLDKPLTRADMDRIAEGITLEDGEIHADEVAYVKENKQEVGVEIHSGRNRIVRRIFEFLGYEVKKLDRVYYAGLTKKNLKRGAWRFLTNEEVQRLKSGQYE